MIEQPHCQGSGISFEEAAEVNEEPVLRLLCEFLRRCCSALFRKRVQRRQVTNAAGTVNDLRQDVGDVIDTIDVPDFKAPGAHPLLEPEVSDIKMSNPPKAAAPHYAKCSARAGVRDNAKMGPEVASHRLHTLRSCAALADAVQFRLCA